MTTEKTAPYMASKLRFSEDGKKAVRVEVRYNDDCHNGHDSLGITASVFEPDGKRLCCCRCGCCHDDIRKFFPELAQFLKWHQTSDDGPMHYVANAHYWAGHCGYCDGEPNSPPNPDHLKSTIVFGAVPKWDDGKNPATLGYYELEDFLAARLPDLMEAFHADMAKLKTAMES
jgi:hypothetical protein